MELKEATRVLNDWNKAEEWTIKDPDYRHKDVYIERKEAIETVLQVLEQLQVEKNHLLLVDLANEKKISNAENRRCMLLAIENNDLKEKLANSISKDKIKEKIEELKVKLKDVSKHREEAKEKEEQAVLWCLEIRLDEQIKTYEELLKGE